MNIPHLLSRFTVAGCVALAGCGGGTRGAPDADPSEGLVDTFAARVLQPILEPSCTGCHRAGKAEKGVILTSYEDLMSQGLVQPGDPAKSKLVTVITTGSMKRYVSPADVEAISLWIADGAPRWARAESLPPPGEPGPTRAVGLKACLVCHGAGPQFAGWFKGAHANRQNWDANTFRAAPGDLESLGFPYYGYNGLGTTAECTSACHDPLGDGQKLTAGLSGNVPRPVIGCESCHGGGAKHYGTGPIPYPRPDFTRCGQCHDGKFAHNPYHPEGDEIVEKYVASPHARSINDRVLA
ncbi:MAG: c-type cytochrome domain-containing protein, partial [Deferrisomatales bacterium]